METTDTLLQLLQEAHKTNQAQQQTIQNLTTEIQLLNEKVNYLTNKLFGRSKETLFEETNGQLNLLVMKPVVLVNFNILKNISKFLQNVVVLDLIEHCKPVICFQIYSLAL